MSNDASKHIINEAKFDADPRKNEKMVSSALEAIATGAKKTCRDSPQPQGNHENIPPKLLHELFRIKAQCGSDTLRTVVSYRNDLLEVGNSAELDAATNHVKQDNNRNLDNARILMMNALRRTPDLGSEGQVAVLHFVQDELMGPMVDFVTDSINWADKESDAILNHADRISTLLIDFFKNLMHRIIGWL